MTDRIVMLPVAVTVVYLLSMAMKRRYKTKKDARSDLMMFAFVGLIIGILVYGIISRI